MRIREELKENLEESHLTFDEFLDHCTAYGGNWTAMLISGIKNSFPEYYNKMIDKDYSFDEIADILVNDLGIIVDSSTKEQLV